MKGPLTYDAVSMRFKIEDRELHCGDCFQIKAHCGRWADVRIELAHSSGWYLIGTLPNEVTLRGMARQYEGCQARTYD
jgi:hypothetical protein